MNLENYVNLTVWVEELNASIQEILLERLQEAIVTWISAFNSEGQANGTYNQKSRKAAFNHVGEENSKTRAIIMEPILHELTIRNQVIFLEPPLEHARTLCFSSLHSCLGMSLISNCNLFLRHCVQSPQGPSISLRIICPSLF